MLSFRNYISNQALDQIASKISFIYLFTYTFSGHCSLQKILKNQCWQLAFMLIIITYFLLSMILDTYEPSIPLDSYLNPQKKQGPSHRRRAKLQDTKHHDAPWQFESIPRDVAIPIELTPSAIRAKVKRIDDRSQTEAKRKEKESRMFEGGGEGRNIFKHPSHMGGIRLSKQDIRLPALDKRQLQESDDPEGKRVVVRIALEKLKRLQPEEVKKRFLLKYHLSHQE